MGYLGGDSGATRVGSPRAHSPEVCRRARAEQLPASTLPFFSLVEGRRARGCVCVCSRVAAVEGTSPVHNARTPNCTQTWPQLALPPALPSLVPSPNVPGSTPHICGPCKTPGPTRALLCASLEGHGDETRVANSRLGDARCSCVSVPAVETTSSALCPERSFLGWGHGFELHPGRCTMDAGRLRRGKLRRCVGVGRPGS